MLAQDFASHNEVDKIHPCKPKLAMQIDQQPVSESRTRVAMFFTIPLPQSHSIWSKVSVVVQTAVSKMNHKSACTACHFQKHNQLNSLNVSIILDLKVHRSYFPRTSS